MTSIGWLVEPMSRMPWTGFWILFAGKLVLWGAAYTLDAMRISRTESARLRNRFQLLLLCGTVLTIDGFIWMLVAGWWPVWLLVLLTIMPILMNIVEAYAYKKEVKFWEARERFAEFFVSE